MRQIILLIVIFVLGAISYPFLQSILSSLEPKSQPIDIITSTNPSITKTPEITIAKPTLDSSMTQKVVIDEQGGLHDGPFTLRDSASKVVTGTVEIIRSPEETLLQFKNTTFTHSDGAHIYFATDKLATKYLDLGLAKVTAGVLIYGMPIDTTISTYTYLLIHNPQTKTTEFFAEL